MRRAFVMTLILFAGTHRASAAVWKWQGSGYLLGSYTTNVYFQNEADQSSNLSTYGGYASATGGFKVTSPRSEFLLKYTPSYNYYSDDPRANNLEHYLLMNWEAKASELTTFTIDEEASYSPESDNFQSRGVSNAFTVVGRARQARNYTELALKTKISPRWTYRIKYDYSLLRNGKVHLSETDSAGVDTNGDGTIDTPQIPSTEFLVLSTLFDENSYGGSVIFSYAVSPRSSFSVKGRYGFIAHDAATDSVTDTDQDGTIDSPPVVKAGEKVLRSNSETVGFTFEWQPTDRTHAFLGLGGFHTRDRSLIPVANEPQVRSRDNVSAEAGLQRSDPRGALTLGLNRGPSTFDGLARAVDTNGDGTFDLALPAGGAIRTTAYASYDFQFKQGSTWSFAVNGSRKEAVEVNASITTIGAGTAFDLRLWEYGGLRAGYRWTRQLTTNTEVLQDRDLSRHAVTFGLFFSKQEIQ